MLNLTVIQADICQAANQSTDPAMKALAKAVEELCAYVESIERLTRLASDDARRAMKMAR